jgi:hypothetical protein
MIEAQAARIDPGGFSIFAAWIWLQAFLYPGN